MPELKIICGDALQQLRMLKPESVQCCVTSPPYWGLRDYGCAGQMGREESPAEFVGNMVQVFEEVRRVLRSDGTLWVNMGDSYATPPGSSGHQGKGGLRASRSFTASSSSRKGLGGLKPKDLCGVPWRLAFGLQDAGWYLRSDIIWHKPNPMPESVSDRPTKAHEYIFLLTKQERYFYDGDSIREPASPNTHSRLAQDVENQIGSFRANGGAKTNGAMKAVQRKQPKGCASPGRVKDNESMDSALSIMPIDRNKRTVWTVPTYSFSGAHFATFPPNLIKPCIMAGSRAGDVVLDPFGGSGTTGQVALELGRSAILIELNPAYVELIKKRCTITPGLGI